MNFDKFKEALDTSYSWPTEYLYKFIIPFTELKELERILGKEGMTTKTSENGKYLSVTFTMEVNSSDEVIKIYKDVSHIKGIISL